MKKPKDYLIFPLDVATYEEAIELVELLKDHVGCFKVGLELFVSVGPRIITEIKDKSQAEVFLDLKFHDIPATIKKVLAAASRYEVKFTTVHCDHGGGFLRAAAREVPYGIQVLGVTVLTSISGENLRLLGYRDEYVNDMNELVVVRARIAREAGCSGVVCSGLEAARVRRELGKDFTVVTPGIRPEWSLKKKDDQKRVITPYQALKNGADYIVVGRPIREAQYPVEAAEKVLDEIELAKF